jgi:hypothetical protein
MAATRQTASGPGPSGGLEAEPGHGGAIGEGYVTPGVGVFIPTSRAALTFTFSLPRLTPGSPADAGVAEGEGQNGL